MKRDRAYLVRLVVCLLLAVAGGGYVFSNLTSDRTKGWVTDAVFGSTLRATESEAPDGGIAQPLEPSP